MNIVQLQDMLRGLPDDRLQQEMQQPTGSVPQYLVLSEIVRRDKMRQGAANPPQTTVVEDVMSQANAMQSAGIQDLIAGKPQMMPQEEAPAYADGGFISPAQAMGNSGFAGYPTSQQQQPIQFGFENRSPQMFTPNTTPQAPAPITNNNINPTIDMQGQQPDPSQGYGVNNPGFFTQEASYADGGEVALSNGGNIGQILKVEGTGKNPRSSATGYGQFLNSTWMQYIKENHPELLESMSKREILNLRNDPNLGTHATTWYQEKKVRPILESAGFEATPGNLYLGHFAGPGGARALLSADPKASARSVLGEDVIKANPFLEGMTARDVINWAAGKMGSPKEMPTEQEQLGLASLISSINPFSSGKSYDLPQGNPADRASGVLSGGVTGAPLPKMSLDFSPDTQEGLRDLGGAIFQKGQQQQAAPVGEISRGDPSLVKGIGGKSPEEQLAEYQSLRRGYMADGGEVIAMQDGSPGVAVQPRSQEELLQEYDALPFYQKVFGTTNDVMRLLGSGVGGDKFAAYMNSLVGDETYEQELADQQLQTEEAKRRMPTTGQYLPYVLPAASAVRFLPGLLGIGGAAGSLLTGTRIGRQVLGTGAVTGGLGYLMGEDGPEGEQAAPASEYGGQNVAPSDYEGAVVESQRGPLGPGGEASKTPVTSVPAAPKTAFDKYMDYMKDRDAQLQEFYQQQIDEERKRQEDAAGFPALLRNLGIGMIATGGRLDQGLQGGLQQALTSREENQAAARDRIRELQMKQKMAGIQGLGDMAKLGYEAELAKSEAAMKGMAGQKDYLTAYQKALEAYSDAQNEGASQETLDQMYRNLSFLAQKAGIPMGGTDPAALAEARRRGII